MEKNPTNKSRVQRKTKQKQKTIGEIVHSRAKHMMNRCCPLIISSSSSIRVRSNSGCGYIQRFFFVDNFIPFCCCCFVLFSLGILAFSCFFNTETSKARKERKKWDFFLHRSSLSSMLLVVDSFARMDPKFRVVKFYFYFFLFFV